LIENRSVPAASANPAPTDRLSLLGTQYSAEDLGGHRWTFSQSIADVDPGSWGATSIDIA
jgi:hypothetical protein